MATLEDLQRQRADMFKRRAEEAQGQIQGQTQANVGALQRRFTSMGAGNTGAALAAEQKAREEGLAQQRQAQTDLMGQQLQAGEGDLARQFQSREAQLAREAQLGESRAAREAQLGESRADREARLREAQLGREAALGESAAARAFQEKMAGQDIAFKRELAQQEQANKLKEMDLAYQQFLLDKDMTEFNKRMAEIEAAGGGGSSEPGKNVKEFLQPVLTGSGPLGSAASPQEALLQGALGPVSVWAEPAKDLGRRIGIKF